MGNPTNPTPKSSERLKRSDGCVIHLGLDRFLPEPPRIPWRLTLSSPDPESQQQHEFNAGGVTSTDPSLNHASPKARCYLEVPFRCSLLDQSSIADSWQAPDWWSNFCVFVDPPQEPGASHQRINKCIWNSLPYWMYLMIKFWSPSLAWVFFLTFFQFEHADLIIQLTYIYAFIIV